MGTLARPLRIISRPGVANLRLNQQPVNAFRLNLATLRLSVYAALALCDCFMDLS